MIVSSEVLLFIVLAVIFLLLIIFVNNLSNKESSEWKLKVEKELSNIIRINNLPTVEAAQSALVKTDKLLDYCLKNRKVPGDSMGLRLKNGKKYFSKTQYSNIWEAHKIRNKIVHDIEVRISRNVLIKHTNYLKSGVKALLK